MPKPLIGRDTRLCMSLSARPGNFGSRFQNRLYEIYGLDFVYKAFSTTDLEGAVRGIRALNIRGCAISMPFKEAVIPLLDALDETARVIASVNTIVNTDGHLTGFNTDYAAVRQLLERTTIARTTPVIVRGSGGMAKAVVAVLRDTGFTNGTVVARNATTGPALAAGYGYAWHPDLPAEAPDHVLVNVTPLGMQGADADQLAFPTDMIAQSALVMDAVALPPETPIIRQARAQGRAVITGAEIIVLQAVRQFALYTGVEPDEAAIADAAAIALA